MTRRFYYYLTLMVLSAEIMVLEIVGAKALSPVFGSSHFVWMSQIIVTLLSLSAGAYSASLMDSRVNDQEKIAYELLVVPSAYIGFSTLFFSKIVFAFIDLSLSVSSLLASIVLYFIPLSFISFSYSMLVSKKIKEYPKNFGDRSYS